MKKIVISIIIIVTVIISVIFVNYIEIRNQKLEILNTNKEFTIYKDNDKLQVNTVITLMNKAIQKNIENDIKKDENNFFIENDTNSIKVFLEFKSRNSLIPMEDLILGPKAGIEKVGYAFSDLFFEITQIEFHQKTGQIKKIVIQAKEE